MHGPVVIHMKNIGHIPYSRQLSLLPTQLHAFQNEKSLENPFLMLFSLLPQGQLVAHADALFQPWWCHNFPHSNSYDMPRRPSKVLAPNSGGYWRQRWHYHLPFLFPFSLLASLSLLLFFSFFPSSPLPFFLFFFPLGYPCPLFLFPSPSLPLLFSPPPFLSSPNYSTSFPLSFPL